LQALPSREGTAAQAQGSVTNNGDGEKVKITKQTRKLCLLRDTENLQKTKRAS